MSPRESITREFLDQLRVSLSEVSAERLEPVLEVLESARGGVRTILLMGNGGSAALAAHFACDLQQISKDADPFRVINLSDNTALVTALANDDGYDEVFRLQLVSLLQPGDVVMAISTSGDSANVERAVSFARERGAVVVGLLASGGGRIVSHVNHALTFETEDPKVAESVFSAVLHLISRCLKRPV